MRRLRRARWQGAIAGAAWRPQAPERAQARLRVARNFRMQQLRHAASTDCVVPGRIAQARRALVAGDQPVTVRKGKKKTPQLRVQALSEPYSGWIPAAFRILSHWAASSSTMRP